MDSFFGIGPMELVFILIFALIFLGPERLPHVIRDVVAFLRKVRAISDEITSQINEELGDLQELRELDPTKPIQETLRSATQPRKPGPPKPAAKPPVKPKPAARPTSTPGQADAPPTTQAAPASSNGPGPATRPAPTEPTIAPPAAEVSEATPPVEEAAPTPPESAEPPTARVDARSVSQGSQISPASAYFAEQQRRSQAAAQETEAAQEVSETPKASDDGFDAPDRS